MSVFAGEISVGQKPIGREVTARMLTVIGAPRCQNFQSCIDESISVAARFSSAEQGVFEDRFFIVVADGRIDNVDDLSAILGVHGEEVGIGRFFAAAFQQWGEALVDRICGEFAFAIWDKREQSLFCGRDRFGRVPLAYLLTSQGIVFASDFLSIAAHPNSDPQANDAWIIEYLLGVVADKNSTPFEGIMRLPPGSVMKWSDHRFSIRQFWTFSSIGPTSESISSEDISRALGAAVGKKIRDSNFVTMLSGGLDSSLIAIMARDQQKQRSEQKLPTISLVFDDYPDQSERPYVESVLNEGGFEPHFVNVRNFSAFEGVQRLMDIHGAPTVARGALISDQAGAEAERLGFSAVLLGHGGDETVSSFGVMRLVELADKGAWGTLLKELFQVSGNSELNVAQNFFGLYRSKGKGFVSKLFRKMHGRSSVVRKRKYRGVLRDEWTSHPSVTISKAVIQSFNPIGYKDERSYHESVLSAPLQSRALEFMHRQYRSRGIRPLYPFWDANVVDYCLRTPSSQKLSNGVPRSLIRAVMGDRLPAAISNRTSKFDFTDCFLRSLLDDEDRLREISIDNTNRVFDFVDPAVFASAVTDLRSENQQLRISASQIVWRTLNLLVWFEKLTALKSGTSGLVERAN